MCVGGGGGGVLSVVSLVKRLLQYANADKLKQH